MVFCLLVAVSRFAREPAGYEPTEVLLLHTAIFLLQFRQKSLLYCKIKLMQVTGTFNF